MADDHYEAAKYHRQQQEHHYKQSVAPGQDYTHHRQQEHNHSITFVGTMRDTGGYVLHVFDRPERT